MTRNRISVILGVLAALLVAVGVFLANTANAATAESEDSEALQMESESDTAETPEPSAPASTARLFGDGRIATAVEISQEAFGAGRGPRDVFIARADKFADALSGGSLNSGPILLVPSCGPVPQLVLDEIERLDPEQVIALGGQSAVCSDTLGQAADVVGVNGTRLFGSDRFSTSVEVAEYGFPTDFESVDLDVTYLATGEDFPDALAAGTIQDGPVLLVPSGGTLPAATAEYLGEEMPEYVVAIGGSSAVSGSMLGQAADAAGGAAMDRLSGEDRIATAIAVADHALSKQPARVIITRADDFPDALAGSVLTGDGPILLTHTGELPGNAADKINALAPNEIVALGGTSAVSDDVLSSAAQAAEQ